MQKEGELQNHHFAISNEIINLGNHDPRSLTLSLAKLEIGNKKKDETKFQMSRNSGEYY